MANSFAAKSVDGQLPSSKGTLYTATAVIAYLKSVQLFNTNVATQTIILYKKGATSRAIARFVLNQNEWAEFSTNMILNSGDLLEAVTTTAAAVDFVASLVEES